VTYSQKIEALLTYHQLSVGKLAQKIDVPKSSLFAILACQGDCVRSTRNKSAIDKAYGVIKNGNK
jgi:hypothetical protein